MQCILKQERPLFKNQVYWFSMAANQLPQTSDLKQDEFIFLQFCSPQVQN